MDRPIGTLVNVKDFTLNRGGNLVGCRNVRVDDQCVVLLFVGRECNLDEVRVRLRVLRHESRNFLHGSFSFRSWWVNVSGTYFMHHRICSLGNLARWYGVPVEGWSLPRPLGNL